MKTKTTMILFYLLHLLCTIPALWVLPYLIQDALCLIQKSTIAWPLTYHLCLRDILRNLQLWQPAVHLAEHPRNFPISKEPPQNLHKIKRRKPIPSQNFYFQNQVTMTPQLRLCTLVNGFYFRKWITMTYLEISHLPPQVLGPRSYLHWIFAWSKYSSRTFTHSDIITSTKISVKFFPVFIPKYLFN